MLFYKITCQCCCYFPCKAPISSFEEFNILNPTKTLGPHGPPAWETAEDIAALYKLLDSVGCKLQVNLSDIKRDKKDQARNQLPETK